MRAVLFANATAATLVARLAEQLEKPCALGTMALRMADDRHRADDQHLPQIAVARSRDEDNIGAFWAPAEPAREGASYRFHYRLRWSGTDHLPSGLARCTGT